MTAQSSIPLKWYVPFAQGDSSRVELPVTTSDPTRASQTLGFPPLTMQPPESGGVPPQGEDFNGGLNQVARVAWWVLNGGGWPYDATFATNSNINGYPNGAKLQSADFRGDWISLADNNQANPDTGTGTAWVPGFQYGSTSLTGLTGGTVTPTPAQASKGSISLAGTLGSALTVILPAWTKNWTIINNTTGAFVTIVKTAAGSGVTIPQGGSRFAVAGDGTNIVAATAVTPGTLLRTTAYRNLSGVLNVSINGGAYAPAGSSTFTAQSNTNACRVTAVGGGGAGGGAPATSSGQVSFGAGGGSGGSAVAWLTSNFSGQTVTVGAGGAAATGTTGGNGGTTSLGALVTAGGGGGGVIAAAAAPTNTPNGGGGNGAIGTGGYINSQGNPGFYGWSFTTPIGGQGGGSIYGGGGPAASGSANGTPGGANGAGGGGASNAQGQGARPGGAGIDGILIIEEYA